MKNTLAIISCAILLCFSCDQEYPTPEDNISCTMNTEAHIKDQAYQTLLDEYATKGLVGITLLTASPEAGTWTGAAGYADIEDGIMMTGCHLHHTASLYKTFISVIIMQLAEEEKLTLDDKIADHLPGGILGKIPNGSRLTIRQLLQHRSGLVDIFELDFLLDFFNNPTRSYSINELLGYMENTKADSEPGTEFYYSDANFALLTLVINAVDASYQQALQSRIFQPLMMTGTHFINTSSEAPAGLADSYWDRYGTGQIENISDIQLATTAGLRGTDGIISSAADLSRFIQAIAHSTLISAESLSEMVAFADVPSEVQEQHGITAYGLGLMKVSVSGDYWYGHLGNHVGSAAMMLYNPKRDMTLIAFINKGTFFSDKMKPLFFAEFIMDVEEVLFDN